MNQEIKLNLTKGFLWITALITFFWWPVGHWVYPDLYHKILGFKSYDLAFSRIIGTLSLAVVIMMVLAAKDPIKNKDMVIGLIITGFLMYFTYVYLILLNQVPYGEFINVALTFALPLVLTLVYPWNYNDKNKTN